MIARRVRRWAARWSGLDLVKVVVLGATGGLMSLSWASLQPHLHRLGVPGAVALLDAIYFLPALLPPLFVPHTGALLLGVVVALAVYLAEGARVGAGPVHFPLQALAQAPLIAAAPEAWLAWRSRPAGVGTMAIAGALTGASSAMASRLVTPTVYAADAWSGALLSQVVAGACAGALVAYGRDLLARRLGRA